ncbi:MAG: BRCT domain-containing protein [Planctomycetota bacterium]
MAVSARRGSPVPLILFIVLFVFSTIALVLVSMELAERNRTIYAGIERDSKAAIQYGEPGEKGLIRQLVEEKQDHKELIATHNKWRAVTGKLDFAEVEKELSDLKRELRGELATVELDSQKRRDLLNEVRQVIDEEVSIQKFRHDLRDLINNELLKARKQKGEVTLMGLITKLEREKVQLKDDYEARLRQEAKTLTELQAEKEDLEKRIEESAAEVRRKEAEIKSVRRQYDEQLKAKEDRVDEVAADLKKARESFRKDLAKVNDALQTARENNRILEDQLENLREQLARRRTTGRPVAAAEEGEGEGPATAETTGTWPAEKPDGSVILVDEVAGVVVDKGYTDGVRRGLKFEVYRPRPDGTREKRGVMIVKSVFQEISRGILSEGTNPVGVIAKGDVIINPAFEPGRAKVFVADSTFTEAQRNTFKELLAEHGSVLEEKVTPRTDYLIIGAREGDKVKQAQEWNVPMIREEELNKFLRRG